MTEPLTEPVNLEVTEEIIETSRQRCHVNKYNFIANCPLALAAQQQFKNPELRIGSTMFEFDDKGLMHVALADLSPEAIEFQRRFDRWGEGGIPRAMPGTYRLLPRRGHAPAK